MNNTEYFKSNCNKWLDCDNKLTELNKIVKVTREQKNDLENNLTEFIKNRDMTDTFIQIPQYKSKIKYHEVKSYENISLRFIKNCLDECISDKNSVDSLMAFIKDKRLQKTKVTIKREADDNC